eukprot:Nitzschia sp. Nitz4//scaffold232_size35869//13014//15023//NITZ4_007805-RA/size35869-processed-gene-0.58-mRNA-1//1//CDS//3329543324//4639//frame0
MKTCQILWSTQSGRAKACARRSKRILTERTNLEIADIGTPFDESPEPFVDWINKTTPEQRSETIFLMFVSTTGDGEHCDSIQKTWKSLLRRSLQPTHFQGQKFAMFALGDRAYGPQFCAAGRKLAVRLLQLGMTRVCDVGYGDDNTPGGGVFRDLDGWLEDVLLPNFEPRTSQIPMNVPVVHPYQVSTNMHPLSAHQTDNDAAIDDESYVTQFAPRNAYGYSPVLERTTVTGKQPPMKGIVVENKRITAEAWDQDTRHIQIQFQASGAPNPLLAAPYHAGDVVSIFPSNTEAEVNKFLAVLPKSLQDLADMPFTVSIEESAMNNSFVRWPARCTLRRWLLHCADIHSLPEREDLRALSAYCSLECDTGAGQQDKLRALSETKGSALYADYILREKRSWADVLFDFESLREEGTKLNLEALLVLLPPIQPRDYSIASAPSTARNAKGFVVDLCVAIVRGKTRLGRSYHGLCTDYLSRMDPATSPSIKVWIQPGSFQKLPMDISNGSFQVPVLCVGAGTGVAPMRSLLLERDVVRSRALEQGQSPLPEATESGNILVFGSRKKASDFYYQEDWESMEKRDLRLLTAFSRDQFQKIYVQRVLAEADEGQLIARHLWERKGALYIAGGPNMARAVKEEVVETLGKILRGGEKEASQYLAQLQRKGLYSAEAWS